MVWRRVMIDDFSKKSQKIREDRDNSLHHWGNSILVDYPDLSSIHWKGDHVQPTDLSSADDSPLADARLWRSEMGRNLASRCCRPLDDNPHHIIIHTRSFH